MQRFFALRPALDALRLTCEAWPLVVRVRLALWREPFPAFHARWSAEVERELSAARAFSKGEPVTHADAQLREDAQPDAGTKRLAWECSYAVSRAARLMPRASCLTQALVLQRLLARRGQDCALFMGALRPGAPPTNPARSRGGSFEAHAWIEWRGRVLIGGDISRWTPFPLNRPRPASAAPPQASK